MKYEAGDPNVNPTPSQDPPCSPLPVTSHSAYVMPSQHCALVSNILIRESKKSYLEAWHP